MRVHFASNADFTGNVDAGLDGKADSGNDLSGVEALGVVDRGAEAMNSHAIDRVPGTGDDAVAEAGCIDDVAGRPVGLRAGHRLAALQPRTQQVERSIPRRADHLPDLHGVRGWLPIDAIHVWSA